MSYLENAFTQGESLENAIKSNIQEQNQEYVTDTLQPRIVAREQEVNRKVFRDNELGSYTWDIEVKGLLRGNAEARAALYKTLFETGSMTKNEIRSEEGFNPLPNDQYADESHTRLDHIPVSLLDKHYNQVENVE